MFAGQREAIADCCADEEDCDPPHVSKSCTLNWEVRFVLELEFGVFFDIVFSFVAAFDGVVVSVKEEADDEEPEQCTGAAGKKGSTDKNC